jgi:hypothetical protein
MGCDPQLAADLRELKRLGARRKLLAPPATTFIERAPMDCHGDCNDPVKIGVLGRTCCHFFAQYEDYTNTLRLEILQRQLVDARRECPERAGHAALGETAMRLFTRADRLDCQKSLSSFDREVEEIPSLDANGRRSARSVSEVFMRLARAVSDIWHWTNEHIGL